jgi:DNA-binding response OmpR family regulator
MASLPAARAPAIGTGAKARLALARPGESIRVLVVEDSFMIVGLLELVFNTFGWTMVGPAARITRALELVATETFEAAMLDINLDGEMSWPVAEALRARGIPFVLSTGYETGQILPENLAGAAVVKKPYDVAQLKKAILDCVSAG